MYMSYKHHLGSKDSNCLKGTGSPDEYVFEFIFI
jgi:hypothetical protein